ncbi:E3 ubiquitin-protein ligase rnf13 [Podochytrium sp. JEL0797]|nr:E3 ubiquitin-protein ligase rnf13 [Podochytrium sp. JEL0797]
MDPTQVALGSTAMFGSDSGSSSSSGAVSESEASDGSQSSNASMPVLLEDSDSDVAAAAPGPASARRAPFAHFGPLSQGAQPTRAPPLLGGLRDSFVAQLLGDPLARAHARSHLAGPRNVPQDVVDAQLGEHVRVWTTPKDTTPLDTPLDTTNESEPDESCSICITPYVENEALRSLPCSHEFHRDCVDAWLTQSANSCPVCRAKPLAYEPQQPLESDFRRIIELMVGPMAERMQHHQLNPLNNPWAMFPNADDDDAFDDGDESEEIYELNHPFARSNAATSRRRPPPHRPAQQQQPPRSATRPTRHLASDSASASEDDMPPLMSDSDELSDHRPPAPPTNTHRPTRRPHLPTTRPTTTHTSSDSDIPALLSDSGSDLEPRPPAPPRHPHRRPPRRTSNSHPSNDDMPELLSDSDDSDGSPLRPLGPLRPRTPPPFNAAADAAAATALAAITLLLNAPSDEDDSGDSDGYASSEWETDDEEDDEFDEDGDDFLSLDRPVSSSNNNHRNYLVVTPPPMPPLEYEFDTPVVEDATAVIPDVAVEGTTRAAVHGFGSVVGTEGGETETVVAVARSAAVGFEFERVVVSPDADADAAAAVVMVVESTPPLRARGGNARVLAVPKKWKLRPQQGSPKSAVPVTVVVENRGSSSESSSMEEVFHGAVEEEEVVVSPFLVRRPSMEFVRCDAGVGMGGGGGDGGPSVRNIVGGRGRRSVDMVEAEESSYCDVD